MKIFSRTIIKFSVFLGLFLFFGQTLFAQAPMPLEAERLYQKYIDNYQSNDPEKLKTALEAAKEFVKKCENFDGCEPASPQKEYFKDAIAALENKIKSKPADSNQANKCAESNRISLAYILSKFLFTSRITKPAEQIGKELTGEIIERKVSFQLNAENEKSLKQAGASESLLKTISQNFQQGNEIEAEKMYQTYVNNYQHFDIKKLKIALETAKDFVKKFESDDCYIEQIKYFKDAIPTLETGIENVTDIHDPVNPKQELNRLKWRTLAKLTEEFEAKNWNEVFALGRQVYELDPEFVPLFTFLASLGYDQAKHYGGKSKYNAETALYAEIAVKLLENSKKDLSNYGALDYSYKTKAEALEKMKEILDFMKAQTK